MAEINERIETVAVADPEHPLGYRIINKNEFDKSKHKEYKGKLFNSVEEAQAAKGGKGKKEGVM